jgi:hypothetical protein
MEYIFNLEILISREIIFKNVAKATFFCCSTFSPQKMDRTDELFSTRSAFKRKGELNGK